MTWLAGAVVLVAGLWLIGLAAFIVVRPAGAERFLRGFAGSPRAHYTEQVLRLIAGSAIVVFSDQMKFSNVVAAFGWLIVATASGLLPMPWKWHHPFARWACVAGPTRLGRPGPAGRRQRRDGRRWNTD